MVKLITTLVLMAFFGFAQAQTLKFSAGYGIPWVSQEIGINSSSIHRVAIDPKSGEPVTLVASTSKSIQGSYGAGWIVTGAFGYRLSENIGMELGLNYSLGKEYTTSSTRIDTRFDVVKSSFRETKISKSRAVLFTPTLKFITAEKIFTPYFLIGPVLGKIKFHRESDRSLEENGSTSSVYQNTKFTGGISIGIRGGIGANVIVNKKVSLFSEIIFTGMNYYPKESEIARYIVNGEDKLNTLSLNVRKTIYEKEVVTAGANDLVNSPGKSVRFSIAMSSLTATAGVLITLR